MSSLVIEIQEARAQNVTVSKDSLTIDLVDGRTITAPLLWYPRLWHGAPKERSNFLIIGDGALIHWPDLDEDLSVSGILAGRRSGETPQSLNRWLAERPMSSKPVRYKRSVQSNAPVRERRLAIKRGKRDE
jgi:hypothetical protein